jgi:hypothetical protein
MRRTTRHADARRRGSAYLLILAVSVILLVIGLSAVTVARVSNRALATDNDWAEAQRLAFSGAEHALAQIRANADWRTKFAGVETQVPFGRGSFRWRLCDEQDGQLGDDERDPIAIIARGTVNDSAYAVALRCAVVGTALPALRTAVHAGTTITVGPLGRLTATGAPISTNGQLRTEHQRSTVTGDVEAHSISGPGTINGNITVPAPAKQMPDAGVFEMYRDMATPIPWLPMIRKVVLSGGLNPWGAPNARGIYYIDAGDRIVTLKNVRIEGTLVIRCRELVLMDELLIHSPSRDQPALIVDGDVTMKFRSTDARLGEPALGTNFNPRGAPFRGGADSDTEDDYPSEIQGLVHVTGDVTLRSTALVRGAILCEGTVACDGSNQIIHDPELADSPPVGYTCCDGQVVPQSWRRIVD